MIENFRQKGRPWVRTFYSKTVVSLLLCLFSFAAYAQEIELTGVVTDDNNSEPLPGVSISIKGTTTGTISDFDGNYTITANQGDVITFQYVGYITSDVEITGQTQLDIAMSVDLVGLDEVVVIGYGTQKKKLNTGATINLKGEDLQKLNTVSPIDALNGNSPGVVVTSDNGVPGSGSSVIIRGAGTMGDPSPLYVVDGVAVGNIDFLSPSDIASIDILKDAASTSIYGSRAANGVILVTTKKGAANRKMQLTYDGYYGWQQMAKKPELADAQTYMELMEEAYAYDGREIDWERETGLDYWTDLRNGTNPGTNYVDEMYVENAPTQSHAINLTGGNENSSFSMGLSYLSQQGIIGFKEISTYERFNARLNSDHIVFKKGGKNILKIGENISFSNYTSPNIKTGNIYWNDLHAALVMYPLQPMYADENTPEEYGKYHEPLDWEALASNPVGGMDLARTSENDHNNLVGNLYFDLEPIKGLILRSAYGFDASTGSARSYSPIYQLSVENFANKDNVTQSMYQNYTWTWTNTLAYSFSIQQQHNFTAMVGHESRKTSRALSMWSSNDSSMYNDWEHAYISNTHSNYSPSLTGMAGGDYKGYAMLSYFGRISYDFNETLLATFVYRADASNNLAPGHQWGDFVSASLGYILTNHDFMDAVPWLTHLKVRGGWGQNGNERIGAFQYNAGLEQNGGSYFFGLNPTVTTTGAYPALNPNPLITWETSEQGNIGFDANFLANRLQFVFDWYNKDTKDWLVEVPKPLSNGTLGAIENGGAVNNTGIELALTWSDNIGNFSYTIGGNFAYNKNEVTELATADGYFNGPANVLNQGSTPINRVEVGYPIGYFRGFETDGIIQTGEELLYARPDTLDPDGNPVPYFSDQRAGDLKFVDQNGDGIIDDDDKVMIGDPTPDYTFGLNFSADYKGAYIGITTYGALGHQIAMSYRPGSKGSFPEYYLDRWTETNPSNTQPRLTASSAHRNYLNVSDYYMHDANFLRISNITVGYDLSRLFESSTVSELRLYFTGQNLFTFTKYPGMDPVVGYGGDVDWGSGIDLGLYPQSKTYMVGVSAKF